MAKTLGIQGNLSGVELRARCPLHSDQNPSFSLNTQTGLWLCHAGCGSGNFTTLVERVQGYNLHESLEWINTKGQRNSVQELSRQLAIELGQNPSDSASDYDYQNTWKEYYFALTNKVMPLWFLKRGFTWETIYHWDIRYDNLTDGIVIPIVWEEEWHGVVLRPYNQLPKYQYNKDLKKSKLFLGEIFPNKEYIILVEGVLDAVWLWQLGYNSVSILGDVLSTDQAKILQRYRYGEIVLAFDNDEAGKDCTQNAIAKLVNMGWLLPQITYINFPGLKPDKKDYRKDPQDCPPDEFKVYFGQREEVNGLFKGNG